MRDAARFFKVLGDETRLEMLWLLFHGRELCVCDFMAALEIPQSKASRHLATLRHAGLVTDRKQGLWSHHSLRPAKDELVRAHLEVLRANLAAREDASELLDRLRTWLDAKGGGATCARTGAAAAPRRRSGARAPRKGARR